jgi:hypothetical protein
VSGFLRPEARAFLLRWRDTLIGLAVAALGLWWAATALGLLRPLGGVLALAGLVFAALGARRARFPGAGGGPSVVEVDERQITYFGPGGGGAVSVDALALVEIRRGGTGAPTWIFHADGQPPLQVPGDAENAAALFDALAPLPGIDYPRAIAAARAGSPGRYTIWQKARPRLH